MPERITNSEAIRAALESSALEFHVAMPGRVEKYDASKQRADIKIELHAYARDGEGGYVAEDFPVLPNVPVAFPQGGGFFCAFPLQKGDPVLVVFCDLPIGAWLQKGDKAEAGLCDPHGLGGAVCYPGLKPTGDPLSSASGSTMKLGKDGTPAAQIEFTDSLTKLGGGDNFVALANKVNDELQKLVTAFNSHTHNYLPGPGAATPTTSPSSAYTRAPVDAQNVKAT